MRRRDRAIATLWFAGSSMLAMVLLVVTWPVIFVPGIWKGYTCWNDEIDTYEL